MCGHKLELCVCDCLCSLCFSPCSDRLPFPCPFIPIPLSPPAPVPHRMRYMIFLSQAKANEQSSVPVNATLPYAEHVMPGYPLLLCDPGIPQLTIPPACNLIIQLTIACHIPGELAQASLCCLFSQQVFRVFIFPQAFLEQGLKCWPSHYGYGDSTLRFILLEKFNIGLQLS